MIYIIYNIYHIIYSFTYTLFMGIRIIFYFIKYSGYIYNNTAYTHKHVYTHTHCVCVSSTHADNSKRVITIGISNIVI